MAQGSIQDSDVKASADVTSDTRLINDTKIYSSILSERLDQAITNGDIFRKENPQLLTNYTITTSVGSNALTINLKTKAGTDASSTDPIKVAFRSTADGTGDFTTLTITSALSLVVSAGSTLGMISGNNATIWVYLFNDAGTPRLGVSQTLFPESSPKASTAEGGAGAADSARVIYTGTAVSGKAYRVLGVMRGSNTTGNWTAVPSIISLTPDRQQSCYVRYNSSTGQSLTNNTNTIIDFNTRFIDTMGLVSGSGTSWIYTCPSPGEYFVSATVTFNSGAGWADGEERFMNVFKNGSDQTGYLYYNAVTVATNRAGMTGSTVVNCGAGDTLAINALQNSGATLTLTSNNAFNTITIFKVPSTGVL